jgi:hypothetical protein
MFKPALITILSLLLVSFYAGAQTSDTSFLNKAANNFRQQAEAQPIEKVYLHLAKPFYAPGDTVWFKAYTVIGANHQLSALSGVLYAELISNTDSLIKRVNLKLTAGVAWGNFNLPRALKAGTYHIRAYTNWMRNQDAAYFYTVYFNIGSAAPIKSRLAAPAQKPDIQFFPEGGNLVTGLRSRVAFKAINADGAGMGVNGSIIDNGGQPVAFFEARHNGMGVFALTPVAGKTYRAVCTFADSTKATVGLPGALNEGFTLNINNAQPDTITLKVSANDMLFSTVSNKPFYIIAQSNGKIYYTAGGKLGTPVFSAKIDKGRFPSGIARFTLFSDTGEPVNERIIFIQNNDTLNLSGIAPVTSAPRQKVIIGFDVQNSDKKAVAGTFSAAVMNESRTPYDEDAESTILTSLLLASDIKGYIEKPNYYFRNVNDQTRADLDLLMLTQGYTRWLWKPILENKKPSVNFPPEKSLQLAGMLKTPSGKPVPNGKLVLLSTKEKFYADTVTDANGNFKLLDLDLSDTAKVVLRARKSNNGGNVAIYVQKPDYPDTKLNPALKNIASGTDKLFAGNNKMVDYREQAHYDSVKNNLLKEVNISGKKKSVVPDKFNNYGTDLEYHLDLNKLDKAASLNFALIGAIPGLAYQNNRFYYDRVSVGVVIDGNDFFNQRSLVSFGVDEVQSITLVENHSAPIIYIVTKRAAGTDTTVLKEVAIKGKKVEAPDMSHSSNLRGGGNADQVLMGDKLDGMGCVNLSDCLRGRITGVNFLNGKAYNTRVGPGLSSGASAMLMSVILDGNTMDASELDNIPAADVYSVEVLRSVAARSIYGTSIQGGGALVITTKRGAGIAYNTSEVPSGLITYPFKGYFKARKFYSPKYDHPTDATKLPDMRSTIFWKPDITTGPDGKASFEYYNDDTKGTYRVVIEGIDDNGNLCRKVYRYMVE